MQKQTVSCFAAVGLLLLSAFLVLQVPVANSAVSKDAEFDTITAQKIVVGNGKNKLLIQCGGIGAQDYVGLWMYSADDPTKTVTLFAGDQFFIGLHSQQKVGGKMVMGGCPIALSVDKNGEPMIQFVSRGKVIIFDSEAIRKIID